MAKDYRKIAKGKIKRPSEKKSPKRRFLIYSRNKKGKTRLAATAPNVIFLDPEKGTDTLLKTDPAVWEIEKWEDLQDAYGFLRLGGHGYEWVCVDGLTRMNNMALRYVMRVAEEQDLDRRPGMVDRRDYNKSGELMKQMLHNFHGLDMGVIFTAQERVITVGDDDEENDASALYVPDLPAGVRGAVNSIVDGIGRLYVTRVPFKKKGSDEIVEKMQRRLFIGAHERYDTGFRSDFELPDFIKNPTIPKLVELMLEGEK